MTVDDRDAGRCPWCSSPLPDASVATCPSCGAGLRDSITEEIPGLTAVDPQVAGTARKAPGRSRLIGWLTGEIDDAPASRPVIPGASSVLPGRGVDLGSERSSLEPPSPEVRREMLRLELEALAAEATAARAADLVDAELDDGAGDLKAADEVSADTAVPPAEPISSATPTGTELAADEGQPVEDKPRRRRSTRPA